MNGNRSVICGFLRGQTREYQEVADGRIQDEDQDRKRRTAGEIESTGGWWSLPVGVEMGGLVPVVSAVPGGGCAATGLPDLTGQPPIELGCGTPDFTLSICLRVAAAHH